MIKQHCIGTGRKSDSSRIFFLLIYYDDYKRLSYITVLLPVFSTANVHYTLLPGRPTQS